MGRMRLRVTSSSGQPVTGLCIMLLAEKFPELATSMLNTALQSWSIPYGPTYTDMKTIRKETLEKAPADISYFEGEHLVCVGIWMQCKKLSLIFDIQQLEFLEGETEED